MRTLSLENLVSAMNKPTLKVTKYAGASPASAVCTVCGRQFKTPLTRLQKASDALASLGEQLEQHTCSAGTSGSKRRTDI